MSRPGPTPHRTYPPLKRVAEGQIVYLRVKVVGGLRQPFDSADGAMVQTVTRGGVPTNTTQHWVPESDLITAAELIRAVREGT
jgi:hypothetical protein